MRITERVIGNVMILDMSGKITLGEGTTGLRNSVRSALDKGYRKIVLNLADVNYIDQSGIGELVSTYTEITNNYGKLHLLNLTKKIQDLLAITRLLTVFRVFDNELLAISSF